MSYWKTKVLPKIQKVFGKDTAKKAAAVEACKSFDGTKEEVSKEFEEKKEELQPKVLEIYEASETEIKALVKDPKEAGLKKHSVKVQKFLDELVKIEFPGSKVVCEASSKFGPTLVSGPIIFVFEKVSTFVVKEDKPREIEEVPAVAEVSAAKEETVAGEAGIKEEVVAAAEEVVAAAEEVAATPAECETAPLKEGEEEPPKVVEEKPQVEEPSTKP